MGGGRLREPGRPALAERRAARCPTSHRQAERKVRTPGNPEPRCPITTQMRSRPRTRASPAPEPPPSSLAGGRGPYGSSLSPGPPWSDEALGVPKVPSQTTACVADAPGPPEEAREAAAPSAWALLERPGGDALVSAQGCLRRVGAGHPALPAQQAPRVPRSPAAFSAARWPGALVIFSSALHLPTCKSSPRSQTRFARSGPQVANLTHT